MSDKTKPRRLHRYRQVVVSPHTIACTKPGCAFQRRWEGRDDRMSEDGGNTWGPASYRVPPCPVAAAERDGGK